MYLMELFSAIFGAMGPGALNMWVVFSLLHAWSLFGHSAMTSLAHSLAHDQWIRDPLVASDQGQGVSGFHLARREIHRLNSIFGFRQWRKSFSCRKSSLAVKSSWLRDDDVDSVQLQGLSPVSTMFRLSMCGGPTPNRPPRFFSTPSPAPKSVVEKSVDGQLKNWIFFHGKTFVIRKVFNFFPNETARISRICLKNLFLT